MIPITINGDVYEALPGQRLLLFLMEKGIRVPHLCFHRALTPAASCKLCVVEIKEKGQAHQTRLACALKIREGLAVTTESAMIHQLRSAAITDLLKLAPHSEAIHRIGREFGLHTGAPPDGCIRCRLCIRVCSEIIGARALTMEKKNGRNFVVPSEKGSCIGCLTCTNLCPTQAIYFVDEGDVRTIMIRDTVVGRHKLEKCPICGRMFATTRFLDHVRRREDGHPEEKAALQYCPTCSKGYYRKNLAHTAPKLATIYGNKAVQG